MSKAILIPNLQGGVWQCLHFCVCCCGLWRPMFSMSAGHKSNVSAGCKNHFLRRRSFTDGRSFRPGAACWDARYMIPLHFAKSPKKKMKIFSLSQMFVHRKIQSYKMVQYKKYTMEKLQYSRDRWNSRGSISLQDVDVRGLHWQDVRGEM